MSWGKHRKVEKLFRSNRKRSYSIDKDVNEKV